MKRRNATRNALLMSVLSMLLCVTMLVGTTFAWFTDSVVSGNNVIMAGNLDIDVLYANTPNGAYETIENVDDLFVAPNGATKGLWEPGHTEVAYLKVVNNGTLALKYQFKVDAASEVIGKSVLGNDIVLSEVLKFAATAPSEAAPAEYDRATAQAAAEASTGTLLGYSTDVMTLAPGAAQYISLVVYMPESVGNEANYRGDAIPTINFKLTALATQVEAENDSFGPDYDKNAWTEVAETPVVEDGVVEIWTAAQLAGVMANTTGIETINIMENIDLSGRTWAPAYVSAPNLVINGNGHTISNMTCNGGKQLGFIGVAYQNITINDLTFKNAEVAATGSFDGIVIGWAWGNADVTFNNVDVIDSEISATLGNKSIRVGGLIGFFPYDGGNLTLKDCDVTGSTISGYHNVGAMVGTTLTQKTVTVENCTAKNNTLKYGSTNVGAFAFGASVDGYTAYVPASGFTAENNKQVAIAVASSTDALNDAIQAGKTEIELTAGNYTMPSTSTNGTVTITGTKDTVIDATNGAYMDSATGVTIEGVTIKTGTGKVNGNGSDYAALYAKDVTYINCTFVGPMRVGRDGAKFLNCTFTQLGNDYIWTYGNDVTFEGCTFNTAGKAILIYSDGGNEVAKVSVKDCKFYATEGATAGAIANQNCAAIEIHNYGNGVNLTTSGNTYDSNFSGEWRIKTYETGRTQIIVNGTEYTTIALDGKTMTIDADKNVTVNP